ncbi:DUF3558 domain-containing protein [Rhodococcus sp. NPDC058505]|uniref:DUF3558 domain-containing protein n=1 Tax=unclassified Rhodococcus (in: high G+C Gram-positive bacteria) TaxID=192944 RepID=UPI00364953ED
MRAAVAAAVASGTVIAAALLAGCGPGPVSGDAEAAGVAAGEPVFSPCDDIPDEVLRGIGVDPATESRDILGVKQPGWNICKWMGGGPALSVFATTYTLDDIRAKDGNGEFADIEIGGRPAFTYRVDSDLDRRDCDVAVESAEGAVLVSVANVGVDPVAEDPCATAVRRATGLMAYIPE